MITLLVIEDDLASARMVRKALAQAHYEIHHAANGFDGLKLARQVLPNIVLVDMNLPDLEGKTVVVQLRGRILPQHTTLIAFTAEDDARTRRVVRALGCDDIIGKPIDTRTFADQDRSNRQKKGRSPPIMVNSYRMTSKTTFKIVGWSNACSAKKAMNSLRLKTDCKELPSRPVRSQI